MNYYLIVENDNPILIGSLSFKKLYTEDGYNFLKKLLKEDIEILKKLSIKDSNNKKYTILEWTKMIESKNIRILTN